MARRKHPAAVRAAGANFRRQVLSFGSDGLFLNRMFKRQDRIKSEAGVSIASIRGEWRPKTERSTGANVIVRKPENEYPISLKAALPRSD